MLEGPCAESEEKHEPASDADAAVVDSLKALDLNRPIREADITIGDSRYTLLCELSQEAREKTRHKLNSK